MIVDFVFMTLSCSYAANCLERSLVIRDAGGPRITSASLAPQAMPLLKNLFAVVENAEFSDNEYAVFRSG